MQRYNLFKNVHIALQDTLFMGAQSLWQQSGENDATGECYKAIKASVEECLQLMHAKEREVLPAVDVFEPAVADALLQQHANAANWAHRLLPELSSPGDSDLAALYKKYLCAQLHCIYKSEEMLNPVLWNYYSDKELQQMEQHLNKTTLLLPHQALA